MTSRKRTGRDHDSGEVHDPNARPVADENGDPARALPSRAVPTIGASQDAPIVLVVVDDPRLRLFACDVLEDAGYRTVEAGGSASAIEALETTPGVGLLFTDVHMPGAMDGLDLAREVNARWPDVLLIVTSGEARLSHADVPDAGRFVSKPYGRDQILGHVAAMFAGEPLEGTTHSAITSARPSADGSADAAERRGMVERRTDPE